MLEENLISENGYITDVKRALLREGFWGRPVRKLVEELRDHFRTKIETLEAQGHSLPEARRIVVTAMGEPRAIATEWSWTLQCRSWTARHSWLMGGIGFCGIWAFYILSTIAFIQLTGMGNHSSALPANPPSLFHIKSWLFLMNWMPWLMGMGLLIWRAVQFPIGWRPVLVRCLALGLATSAWQFSCPVSTPVGIHGCVTFGGQTWMSLWAYPVAYYLHMLHEIGGDRDGMWASIWLCPGLFKLLFPLLAYWVARWIATRSSNLTFLDRA